VKDPCCGKIYSEQYDTDQVFRDLNVVSQTLYAFLPTWEYALLSAPASKYREKLNEIMTFLEEKKKWHYYFTKPISTSKEICFVFVVPGFAHLSSDNSSINTSSYLRRNTFRYRYASKHKLLTVTADWSVLMVRITWNVFGQKVKPFDFISGTTSLYFGP